MGSCMHRQVYFAIWVAQLPMRLLQLLRPDPLLQCDAADQTSLAPAHTCSRATATNIDACYSLGCLASASARAHSYCIGLRVSEFAC